jgi:hypothetical protein
MSWRWNKERIMSVEKLERRISDLENIYDSASRSLCEAETILSRIMEWTHEHGAALCPPGADTYGEGMRDAKTQVSNIIRKKKG